jgi:hypothetical protein
MKDTSATWCHPSFTLVILSVSEESRCPISRTPTRYNSTHTGKLIRHFLSDELIEQYVGIIPFADALFTQSASTILNVVSKTPGSSD